MRRHGRPRGAGPHGVAVVTPHVAQLRAMLAFERSLVDRVGPPGCAARETAAANVAALEWVLARGINPVITVTPKRGGRGFWVTGPDGQLYPHVKYPETLAVQPQGSPDAWDRSRPRGSRLTRDKASPPVTKP